MPNARVMRVEDFARLVEDWQRIEGDLDAGIRPYVKILHQNGIETFESCEGGPGHAFPEPTIRFHGQQSEGWIALCVAQQHALPVFKLNRSWTIQDGEPVGPHWEMTFSRKADRQCS